MIRSMENVLNWSRLNTLCHLKIGWKKIALCVLIYVPPIMIVAINPTVFIRALGYAGGIGCGLLLGLLPVIMVWVGRYKKGYTQLNSQLPGGRVLLSLLARVGFVDSHYLKKRRKYVIVIIFAVAALLTPPDPITQIGLGIPLLILYELSILSVSIIEKKKNDA